MSTMSKIKGRSNFKLFLKSLLLPYFVFIFLPALVKLLSRNPDLVNSLEEFKTVFESQEIQTIRAIENWWPKSKLPAGWKAVIFKSCETLYS